MSGVEDHHKKIPIEAAPLYRRIHYELREAILSGRILPGEMMPSEKDITRRYGISRFTAQQVYRLLVDEGLVVRRRGRGTFVLDLSGDEHKSEVVLHLGALHTPDTPLVQAQYRFARRVAELTRNQVRIENSHSSSLGSGSDQLAQVSRGDQDMFGAATDWLEQLDASWGVTNLPFLFSSMDHAKLFAAGDIAEELRTRLLEETNLRVLADNWIRPSRVILTARPCFEPDDLVGLSLRVPPIPTYRSIWYALGAEPVDLAWSEIMGALRDNVVRGVDAPRDVLYQEGFHRLARYITETRHLYSRACVVISEHRFRKLRGDVQEALVEAARETGERYSEAALAKWRTDMQLMVKEGARFIFTDTEPFRAKTAAIYGSRPEFAKWVEAIIALQSQVGEDRKEIQSNLQETA